VVVVRVAASSVACNCIRSGRADFQIVRRHSAIPVDVPQTYLTFSLQPEMSRKKERLWLGSYNTFSCPDSKGLAWYLIFRCIHSNMLSQSICAASKLHLSKKRHLCTASKKLRFNVNTRCSFNHTKCAFNGRLKQPHEVGKMILCFTSDWVSSV